MTQDRLKNLFIIFDCFTAILAWAVFFYFRKVFIEKTIFQVSEEFFLGIVIVPLGWIALYYTLGTYNKMKRMYLMKITSLSFKAFILGTLIIFFFLLLDDDIIDYKDYYWLFFGLLLIHSVLTFIPRFLITFRLVRRIARKEMGFNTLLIGGSEKAIEIYREIDESPKGLGNIFLGFISLNGYIPELPNFLWHLGVLKDLETILDKHHIEEVIIALDSTEQELLKQIINRLQGRDIVIKITANMYDLISGSVKTSNIYGALLIEVDNELMSFWQFVVKRIFDIVSSLIAMVILSPIYLILIILIKSTSQGPIFFTQERIGKEGIPFNIIKFRSMVIHAESSGPQLSSDEDPRVTKIGRFMRKYRFDETPQFWNVLRNDMSLVGPRPERKFYIDQIIQKEPQFIQLNKVKPGITSWGQIKFGYASNVDEMIRRMKYDLLYLKNMSIALDFKILLYTVLTVLKGSGR